MECWHGGERRYGADVDDRGDGDERRRPQTDTASVGYSDQYDPNLGEQHRERDGISPQQADLAVAPDTVISATAPNVGDHRSPTPSRGPQQRRLNCRDATSRSTTMCCRRGCRSCPVDGRGHRTAAKSAWSAYGTWPQPSMRQPSGSTQTLTIQALAKVTTAQINDGHGVGCHSDQYDPELVRQHGERDGNAAASGPGGDQRRQQCHAERRQSDRLHGDVDEQRPEHGHERVDQRPAAGRPDVRFSGHGGLAGQLRRRNRSLDCRHAGHQRLDADVDDSWPW